MNGRLLAAINTIGAIATAPFAWLVALFGLEIGERRGYEQPLCAICLADVHDEGETCHEQRTGDCDVCGTVDVDRFGNCPSDNWRFHHISNRRFKPSRRGLRKVVIDGTQEASENRSALRFAPQVPRTWRDADVETK